MTIWKCPTEKKPTSATEEGCCYDIGSGLYSGTVCSVLTVAAKGVCFGYNGSLLGSEAVCLVLQN